TNSFTTSSTSISLRGSSFKSSVTPQACRKIHHTTAVQMSSDLEERRRRVRSQVWALRRLSNGLDGTSWHSRSCARNHHGHRCSCEGHDMGDDTETRASISRIIMLAEALFEVLDEIHRQSMALSQSATVPLASRPAPTSVVDAIPLRTHCKPVDDCDEAPQCYICLVEYEEGDSVRTLPCNHEYHKNCVDKWLTEIHGVCPLCRGNVCEPKALCKMKLS
ncbi:unnamed protein product, partial [Sphagnum jensenii]